MFCHRSHFLSFLSCLLVFVFPPGSSQGKDTIPSSSGNLQSASEYPVLAWQTYLGGMGRDAALGVAPDGAGNVYVAGKSPRNWGIPLKRHTGGKSDAFVAKLGRSGNLLWNTFLGSSLDDVAVGISVCANRILVSGVSARSWGIPIRPFSGGYDAFVASLSTDGVLSWNTFLGGASLDAATGIGCDAAGSAYVAGVSLSTWGSPINSNAWGGISDAFVAKLDANGNLVWNAFLGSTDYDIALGLALDGSDGVFVSGISKASWGTPVRAYSGGDDGFVAKLSNAAGVLQWNTFLGSPDRDLAVGITAYSVGNVVVVGRSNAAWGNPIHSHTGPRNSFAAKLDGAGRVVWNTFFGSSQAVRYAGAPTSPFSYSEDLDGAIGVALDGSGGFVVGGTCIDSWGSPARAHSDGMIDAFVAKFDIAGSLKWNAFTGIASAGLGIAADGKGGTYLTGIANDSNARTLYRDAFVVKFLNRPSSSSYAASATDSRHDFQAQNSDQRLPAGNTQHRLTRITVPSPVTCRIDNASPSEWIVLPFPAFCALR